MRCGVLRALCLNLHNLSVAQATKPNVFKGGRATFNSDGSLSRINPPVCDFLTLKMEVRESQKLTKIRCK